MACKGKDRLIIFSGPSGVGKTPLIHALDRMYPDISESLEPLVLYNDRQPRPGERNGFDYHFRTTDEMAGYFDWVIPNHDGEDSENRDAFYYPIGDARKALETFRSLLQGETPDHAERWDDKRPAD